MENIKEEIKFMQNAIKHGQKKARVHYSKGGYTKESGLSDEVITVYAKDYSGHLPKELSPENESDMMTDYFETDRARIHPGSKHYKQALAAYNKAKAHDEMIRLKRAKKYGWTV